MTVVRIAPSPTGSLHIGTARTALFNLLYAKSTGGKMHVRIEDTDKVRSKDVFSEEIIETLKWLGITWDLEIVYQSQRQARHIEVAHQMISLNKAYYCYTSAEEIAKFREENGFNAKFVSPWRDNHENMKVPHGVNPAIRLKVDTPENSITLDDITRGKIEINSSELDDIIILRSDGTPTYMFAVVVDDYDIGITHVIRGDDHITNTFRQMMIYRNLSWQIPKYAHLPLIYGEDGTKLSKRHGAVSVSEYKSQGYLPEAMCSYMMEMGWNTDNEILSIDEAAARFKLEDLDKSPSRFNIKRLEYINKYYIKEKYKDDKLTELVCTMLDIPSNNPSYQIILTGMKYIKLRATTVNELASLAKLLIGEINDRDHQSIDIISSYKNTKLIDQLPTVISDITIWNIENIKERMKDFAQQENYKMSDISKLLQAIVVGSFSSISAYEMCDAIGKDEVIARIYSITK